MAYTECRRRIRAAFLQSAETSVRYRHLPAIRSLCKQLGISRLWVFGSVARGEWNPSQSDVDFLVEFSPDHLPADQLLGLYAGLTEMFPCHIDLVSMRAVKNKLFRLELGETRVTLYAAA